jgi:uncharacterized membrane protein YdbT with pleckstrin-like domain
MSHNPTTHRVKDRAMSTTEREATATPTSQSGEATADATVATLSEHEERRVPAATRLRPPSARTSGLAAATALAVGAVGMTLARRMRRSEDAHADRVLFTARPRRVLWRYAGTLGLWEVVRRATRFTVTDRSVLIHEGVLHRSHETLPLASVRAVRVVSGPWQGFVEVRGGVGKDTLHRSLGPLRTPRARELAKVIARGAGL